MRNLLLWYLPQASLLAMSISASAQGYFINGNELHEACGKKDGFAIGFITGLVDGVKLQANDFEGKMKLCIPEKVTAGQIRDIVCQHVDKNPKVRHYPASFAAGSAMLDAFPCPSEKKKP